MQTAKLVRKFRQILRSFEQAKNIPERRHFLVACSGGADSLALWQLLLQNKSSNDTLTLVHVWHNLRKEAEAEYLNLKEQAHNFNSRLLAFKVDVTAYGKKYKLSEEIAARELRRLTFAWASAFYTTKEITNLEQLSYDTTVYLTLAQHLGDQAETVLAHALKGTGLRGLSGIWPLKEHTLSCAQLKTAVQDGFIEIVAAPVNEKEQLLKFLSVAQPTITYIAWRPLLAFSKADLLAYVNALGLLHAEDQSNYDIQYERNYLRQTILPMIAEKFTKAATKLADLAEISQQHLQVLDYLLSVDTKLQKAIYNLTDLVQIGEQERALAVSLQPNCKLEEIPQEVITVYWQRLFAKYLPDILLSRRQQLMLDEFIYKAINDPTKNLQVYMLSKNLIAVLLDSCLIVFFSPDLKLVEKQLDKKLVWQKCLPFFYEHYGRKIPLAINWHNYFNLQGHLGDEFELRSARADDYLLVEHNKQLNLYAYFQRLAIPKELYSQIMVLVMKNTQHVYHVFYRKLAKDLIFQPKK